VIAAAVRITVLR